MNRAAFALVAVLCLLSVSSITGLIQVAKAEGGTITINADGSISPSTAPIYSADNFTYTLTGNITANADGIMIERDNIILDGTDYNVMGSGIGNGATLTNIDNVTIDDMTIINFSYGIWLDSYCDNNVLSGNNIANNGDHGILLYFSSDNNVLSGNNVANNGIGIELDSSSNSSVSGNNITNNGDGFYLHSSSNNSVSGNNVTANSGGGIQLYSSSNNTLSCNTVTANSDYGIYLDSSSHNTLSGNTVTANTYDGIYLYSFSNNNTLSGNTVTANKYDGISLSSSSYNVLSGNNVMASTLCGIYLYSSSNNSIFYNNFVNDTIQEATTFGSTNVWDIGSRGNYWSDYRTKYPNTTETDGSGVWNTPYLIDMNNIDHYPLMVPYAIVPEFPSYLVLSLFMIATLPAVILCKRKGVRTRKLDRA